MIRLQNISKTYQSKKGRRGAGMNCTPSSYPNNIFTFSLYENLCLNDIKKAPF